MPKVNIDVEKAFWRRGFGISAAACKTHADISYAFHLMRSVVVMAILGVAAQPSGAGAAAPSFREDVMAAISKAGCNLGTCHGNATGKGGFKLSLRGDDPAYDYAALARDVAGRRVNAFEPERSLLLAKGSNQLAHEGGKKLDPNGWEYSVLRDWIAGGMADEDTAASKLERIEVTPRAALLDAGQEQVQIRVEAVYAGGGRRDVTERAVYEPLQNGLVEVSADGLVRRLQYGEPTVLVRYLGHALPVRLTFVETRPDFVWKRPRQENVVDRHVFAKLKALRVNPGGTCSDEVFARRAWLDLTGVIPPADEARDFVSDRSPEKRARLVERLMTRPEFAEFWALKWADVLKVEGRTLDATGMAAFHGWLRDHLARNTPVNAMVRDMLAARGSTYKEPAANFYRANRTPTARGVAAAQVFLGTRLQCAECHNHPFDVWTQDDYYNWAAVFGAVDYEILKNERRDKSDKHEFKGEQVVFLNRKLKVDNPRTGEAARAAFLGAPMPTLASDEDELKAVGEWLTSPGNPLFAKAQVNRVWYHLLGRGLVDPVDDFRLTNPASHPALLDALAGELVDSGFDLRHLIRLIMLSRTYQLDDNADAAGEPDAAIYARTAPRRLSAEQLYDSVHTALRVSAKLEGKDVPLRAAQIAGPMSTRGSPEPGSAEAFLAEFGKPKRELDCECERGSDTSIGQVFQLIVGPVVDRALGESGGLLDELARSEEPAGLVIESLYWTFLTRAPNAAERAAMERLLAQSADRRRALEDIAWSLINAKEFVLRR